MSFKVLVGITIQENSRRLIDEGARLARELSAPLHILHIRQGNTIFDHPESSQLLEELFTYGGDLGGEVHFICDENVSSSFINFIKDNPISHLVIGEAPMPLTAKTPSIYRTLSQDLPDVEIVVLQRSAS